MDNHLIDVLTCFLLFIVTAILSIWTIVSENALLRFLTLFILLVVWTLFILHIVKLVLKEDKDEDK